MMSLGMHLFADSNSNTNTIISFTNERIPSLLDRLGILSPLEKSINVLL